MFATTDAGSRLARSRIQRPRSTRVRSTDSQAFKKSVGLNGVGIKAVNALSNAFHIQSHREGKTMAVDFVRGEVTKELKDPKPSREESGTELIYEPDVQVFGEYTL